MLAGFLLLSIGMAPSPVYDFVIRHARVCDGTGNPAIYADVAVSGSKIAKVGFVDGTALEEIDGTGKVLCPGFIDVHTHSEDIATTPKAENFVRMGVTTIITG